MILVGSKLLSEDIFDKHFACDLNACKGACCVEGEGGAGQIALSSTPMNQVVLLGQKTNREWYLKFLTIQRDLL